MQTYIFEKVVERRQKVGVITGFKSVDGDVKIGWSKCNFSEGDKFNLDAGLILAETRACQLVVSPPLPLSMTRKMKKFEERCRRYFKDVKSFGTVKYSTPVPKKGKEPVSLQV
jgi:hypothetical protein